MPARPGKQAGGPASERRGHQKHGAYAPCQMVFSGRGGRGTARSFGCSEGSGGYAVLRSSRSYQWGLLREPPRSTTLRLTPSVDAQRAPTS